MANTYIAKQGDVVDLICARYYGRTRDVTEMVLDANPGVAALGPVLPMGTALVMPDAPRSTKMPVLLSLWD
jgi:phage tail protein X